MATSDSTRSYGWLTRGLHWFLFLLIAAQFSLALVFNQWPDGASYSVSLWLHESTGFLILIVGAAFVIWRLMNPKPTLAHLPAWQRGLATTVHILIFAALIAQPVFGIIMNFGYGFGIPFYGLFYIPGFIPIGRDVGSFFALVHSIFGIYIILTVLGIHVLATLYHAWFRRDGIVRRMWRGHAD